MLHQVGLKQKFAASDLTAGGKQQKFAASDLTAGGKQQKFAASDLLAGGKQQKFAASDSSAGGNFSIAGSRQALLASQILMAKGKFLIAAF